MERTADDLHKSKYSVALRSMPLTQSTVFVYRHEFQELGPCMLVGGGWRWFPEPKAVVGYLRFIVAPEFFVYLSDYGEAPDRAYPLASV